MKPARTIAMRTTQMASRRRSLPRSCKYGDELFYPSSIERTLGRIRQRPCAGSFRPLFSAKQHRTIFSFLPENEEAPEPPPMEMPSRQIDTDLARQQEESRNLRDNFHQIRQEVFDLIDSPSGSFPWKRFSPMLYSLCETENTIHHAFHLLDRASLESNASVHVTNDMVDHVVRHWLNGYIEQQKHIEKPYSYRHRNKRPRANGDDDPLEKKTYRKMSPLKVWKKVSNYQSVGIPLESPVYHKIMEGTTHVKTKSSKVPHGPRLAETILEEIMEQSKRKNPLIRPSAHAFTIAMHSWEQAATYSPLEARGDAPKRALALLHKLKTLYATGWGKDFMPDKNAYRRVMNIFAHRGDADQVEALLEDLYTMYLDHAEQGNENSALLLPTAPFFSLVLYAWSKSKDPDAPERAEAILNHMLELEESGEIPNLKIQTNFFNIVMVCWSKQRTLESAAKVQDIFDRLVEYSKSDPDKGPVGASYLALITTWSRFDAAKSEEVFWKWKEQHDAGVCEMIIDSHLIRMLVLSWSKSNDPNAAERSDRLIRYAMQETTCHLSSDVFHSAIHKWCQEKTLAGLENAEALLEEMIAHHTKDPSRCDKPTNMIYLPLVRSWAEIGQMERAEELLVDYFTQWREASDPNTPTKTSTKNEKERHIDTRIFNYVLRGWLEKASTLPEAVIRAEDMLLLTRTYDVTPNYASFQYVLDAWHKNHETFHGSQDRPRAEAILSLLDHAHERTHTKERLYLKLKRGWKILGVQ